MRCSLSAIVRHTRTCGTSSRAAAPRGSRPAPPAPASPPEPPHIAKESASLQCSFFSVFCNSRLLSISSRTCGHATRPRDTPNPTPDSERRQTSAARESALGAARKRSAVTAGTDQLPGEAQWFRQKFRLWFRLRGTDQLPGEAPEHGVGGRELPRRARPVL